MYELTLAGFLVMRRLRLDRSAAGTHFHARSRLDALAVGVGDLLSGTGRLALPVCASWLIHDESLHKGEADHQIFTGHQNNVLIFQTKKFLSVENIHWSIGTGRELSEIIREPLSAQYQYVRSLSMVKSPCPSRAGVRSSGVN